MEQNEKPAAGDLERRGKCLQQRGEIGIGSSGGQTIDRGTHPNECGIKMIAIERNTKSEHILGFKS